MRWKHRGLILAVAALTCSSTFNRAQSAPAGTDRVEEDWKLVIATPDLAGAGPQITTCMFPDGNDFMVFVAFNLNYRASPSFAAGGVEIQAWNDGVVEASTEQGSARCETADEQITWTQRMSLAQGVMTYSIADGESSTWGKFGHGNGPLHVQMSTLAKSFDSYSPGTSTAHSGVGWQEDRVSTLTLVRVRYYSGGNLLATDTEPRTVVDNTGN